MCRLLILTLLHLRHTYKGTLTERQKVINQGGKSSDDANPDRFLCLLNAHRFTIQ